MRMDTLPGGNIYRPEGEVDEWSDSKDPIKIFRSKLTELGYLDDKTAEQIDTETIKLFKDAADFALNSTEPEPETAFTWVYAEEGGR